MQSQGRASPGGFAAQVKLRFISRGISLPPSGITENLWSSEENLTFEAKRRQANLSVVLVQRP